MTMRHKKDNFFSIRLQNDRLFKTAIKAVTSGVHVLVRLTLWYKCSLNIQYNHHCFHARVDQAADSGAWQQERAHYTLAKKTQ